MVLFLKKKLWSCPSSLRAAKIPGAKTGYILATFLRKQSQVFSFLFKDAMKDNGAVNRHA